jgi:hypothetical protein
MHPHPLRASRPVYKAFMSHLNTKPHAMHAMSPMPSVTLNMNVCPTRLLSYFDAINNYPFAQTTTATTAFRPPPSTGWLWQLSRTRTRTGR